MSKKLHERKRAQHLHKMVELAKAAQTSDEFVSGWNSWVEQQRRVTPGFRIELGYVNLVEELKETCLFTTARGAPGLAIDGIDLKNANLTFSRIENSVARKSSLVGSLCRYASFVGTNLNLSDLSHADFYRAQISGVYLSRARIVGANFTNANISGANVFAVEFSRHSMGGRYEEIAGVETTYGESVWRRSAMDQDYIDTKVSSWARRYAMRVVVDESPYGNPIYFFSHIAWRTGWRYWLAVLILWPLS